MIKQDKSLTRDKSLICKEKPVSGYGVWSLAGGAALLLAATVVLINLPDIKRYIKISSM